MENLIELFNELRNLYHPKFVDDHRHNEDVIMKDFFLRVKRLFELTDTQTTEKVSSLIKKLFQYEEEFDLKYGALSIIVLNSTYVFQKLITISSGKYVRKNKKKKTLKEIQHHATIADFDEHYDKEESGGLIEEWTN